MFSRDRKVQVSLGDLERVEALLEQNSYRLVKLDRRLMGSGVVEAMKGLSGTDGAILLRREDETFWYAVSTQALKGLIDRARQVSRARDDFMASDGD